MTEEQKIIAEIAALIFAHRGLSVHNYQDSAESAVQIAKAIVFWTKETNP
jgi:hypothetical protein